MSEELERITILLQAKDRDFARAMERNNKLIAKMARDATKNTDAMSAKVNSHLSSMGAGAMSFAKNFAAGLAGGVVSAAFAGVSASIRELVGQVADLQDQADNMGFGVEDLQGLQAGFKLAGVEIDATTSALEIFSQRVGEAAEGDGALAKALAARGIALRDAAGNIRPVIDLLRDYADAIAAAGTDPERLSMAVDAFGKGGKAMALGMAEGAAGVDRMIAAAKEAGLVLDTELVKRAAEIDDKFDILTMKIGNYFKGVAVALADVPFDVFDTRVNEIFGSEAQARSILGDRAFEDLKAAVALTDQQAEAAQRLRGVYDGLGEDARRLAIDFAGAAETADQLGNDTLWIALATASNDMRTLADQFAAGEINGEQFAGSLESVRSKAADALGQLSDIDKQSFAGVISNLGALWGALNALIPKAAALKSALPGSAVGFSPDLNRFAPPTRESMGMVVVNTPDKNTPRPVAAPQNVDFDWSGNNGRGGKNGKGGGGGRSSDRYGDKLDSFREETAALLAEAAALNDAVLGFDEYGIAQDVARKKAELLQAAQNAGKTITPELTAEIDALAASYADAAKRAEDARQRHDDFRAALAEMKSTGADVFEGLLTGSMKFKDALGTIAAKLASMAANRLFESLWTNVLGGAAGGFLGMLGFSSGGYTGPGGRNQAAGVVHKGEVVFSQDDVRKAGGVAAVEAIRKSGAVAMAPARALQAPAPQRDVAVQVVPSPYFDVRVAEVSSYGDAQTARMSQRAMPGLQRDNYLRGTK